MNTFTHKGRRFKVEFLDDEDSEPPWDRSEGHGPVSEWTTRDKAPGERLLSADHGSKRYYDYAEAVRIAKRDGWDAEPYKTGTKGEQAVRAVEADFEFLRGWCRDEWSYIGVSVTMLGAEDEPTEYSGSLWGVESCGDYKMDVARELADECIYEAAAKFRSAMREARERRYWENRDVRTI